MKKIFLFDMDGTLTLPRKKINHEMISNLKNLQKNHWDVGIISGSDMDYIEQQCNLLFDLSPADPRVIHFLPCNGTKYYYNFKKVWEYDMRSKLGENLMTKVYRTLLSFQGDIVANYADMPLTGNFFQMRGSVLNWCPIGRNAMETERKKWLLLDKKYAIRESYIKQFNLCFTSDVLTIKLGGETSFDIYPKGWNKTFPLDKEPFLSYEKIYFAGDRCAPTGNDEELYSRLIDSKTNNAFQVNNPEETIQLINKTIEAK